MKAPLRSLEFLRIRGKKGRIFKYVSSKIRSSHKITLASVELDIGEEGGEQG